MENLSQIGELDCLNKSGDLLLRRRTYAIDPGRRK